MKRSKVPWSNATDLVEGPCVVCGKEVQYVIPDDRPDPAILFHATCDPMIVLRERLKTATPPPLPESFLVSKPAPTPPPVHEGTPPTA